MATAPLSQVMNRGLRCRVGLHKWFLPRPTEGDLRFVEDGLSLGLPVATYMKCERCGAWDV